MANADNPITPLESILESRRNDIANFRRQIRAGANWSLWLGTITLLIAIGFTGWIAKEMCYEQPQPIYKCSTDKAGAMQPCCAGGYQSYDASIYAFLALAALGFGVSFLLIRSYASAAKQEVSFQRELITMKDIEVAYEISKALPDELVKQEMIKEKKGDGDGDDRNIKSDKLFPKVKAQQQIIETLLSKYAI
jgi:hypothetical protein